MGHVEVGAELLSHSCLLRSSFFQTPKKSLNLKMTYLALLLVASLCLDVSSFCNQCSGDGNHVHSLSSLPVREFEICTNRCTELKWVCLDHPSQTSARVQVRLFIQTPKSRISRLRSMHSNVNAVVNEKFEKISLSDYKGKSLHLKVPHHRSLIGPPR